MVSEKKNPCFSSIFPLFTFYYSLLTTHYSLLLIGGILIVGAFFFIRFLMHKSDQMDALRKVRHQLSGRSIQRTASKAHCLGMGRSWDTQWQGYGVLVLTKKILYFRLWKRDLDLTIPLDRIEGVKITLEHGQRALRDKHLQLDYRGMDGRIRTVTWQVRKPEQWLHQMEELMEKET